MAVKIKKVKLAEEWKVNAGKYIAQTVQYPTVETESLAQQVALNTGYPKANVQMILENCLDAAATFLSIGHPVRLGKIGVVRVNASSSPVEEAKDLVVELKPGFRCSSELKTLVKNFEKSYVTADKDEVVEDTGDDEVNTGDDNENPSGGTGGTNPPAGGGGNSVD